MEVREAIEICRPVMRSASLSDPFREALSILIHYVEWSEADIRESTCDVLGCSDSVSAGGTAWGETGYWRVCSVHSLMYREGAPPPQMKQDAIDKEATRLPNGFLPSI